MLRWFLWLLLLPILLPLHAVYRLLAYFKPARRLSLTLRGAVSDIPEPSPFTRRGTALLPILASLSQVERDSAVTTLLVRVEELAIGLGHADELREALRRVRESGTEVVLHADELSTASYWVALGASRIVLSPSGGLGLSGLASEFLLLRGLLDKVGVQAQFRARGKYKSMVERFTAHEMTEPNLEMVSALAQDIYSQLKGHIETSRGIGGAALDEILKNAPLRAKEALDAKLVDELVYEDELASKPPALELSAYARRKARRFLPTRLPAVALLSVRGTIIKGRSGGAGNRNRIGDRSFVKAVKRAVESNAQAILVRVDSPGGSALASDLMWRGLRQATKKKPVFISMGNVAASGGYYISGIGDAPIFASPASITGSIGVVAGKFSVQAVEERIGTRRQQVEVGPRGGFYSSSRAWNEGELQKLEQTVDALYDEFVGKMAEARSVTSEQLDAVAQGRVWTGRQAAERKLVDELGGFHAALAALKERLEIAPDAPVALKEFGKPSFFERLRSSLSGEERALAAVDTALHAVNLGSTNDWALAQLLQNERALFLMPLHIPDKW